MFAFTKCLYKSLEYIYSFFVNMFYFCAIWSTTRYVYNIYFWNIFQNQFYGDIIKIFFRFFHLFSYHSYILILDVYAL